MAVLLTDPVALLFPGQGVQREGMGRKLYDRYPLARVIFERASDVLHLPMTRLCLEGPAAELGRTENLQPAVLTVSWAAHAVFRQERPTARVAVVAGHSLGELAALAAAGALPWETTLELVRARGELMGAAAADRPGGMLAIVGLGGDAIQEILAATATAGRLWIANHNADEQFVLSGEGPAIQAAERLALEMGARRALVLAIPLPAHCPLMERAASAFALLVDRLPLRAPEVPVLANANARALTTAVALRRELAGHLRRPVEWARTMLAMQRMSVRTVVELGPGRVLASLAAKYMPGVETWNADELLVDFAGPA